MDQDRIKLIIRNIELLIDALKAEIYTDAQTYKFDDIEPVDLDDYEPYDDKI